MFACEPLKKKKQKLSVSKTTIFAIFRLFFVRLQETAGKVEKRVQRSTIDQMKFATGT